MHNGLEAAATCVDHKLHNVELVLVAPLTETELFSTPVR